MSSESRVGRLTRRDFLKMGGGALAGAYAMGGGLAGCGGGSSGGPTELTLWAWLPDFQTQVDMFEKANKNIKVKLVNAGQGETEYEKLRTALKAGSGAPDVVHMEFQYIPTFRQIDGLADISEFGANDYKNDYAPWTWAQVSEGDAVYAMPWDSGPMAMLYRKDIFNKYGIEVLLPGTSSRRRLRSSTKPTRRPTWRTSRPSGGWLTGLMWQAGARPFEVDGTKVTISMDDPAIQKFSEYWGDLVDRGVVATNPGFTNDWYRSFAKGIYATWPTAAWGPVFLEGVAGESMASGGPHRSAVGRRRRHRPTGAARRWPSPRRARTPRRRRNSPCGSPTTPSRPSFTPPSSSSSRCSTTSWTALRSRTANSTSMAARPSTPSSSRPQTTWTRASSGARSRTTYMPR